MSGHVVVVGGGIAGLAAAYALRRECPAGTRVSLVEGGQVLGGKLRTSQFAGRLVDEGAEMFLARVPDAVDLTRALGLAADLVHPRTTAASIAVAGTLRPLPAGTALGVPADLDALAQSKVLSPAALARVRAEADEAGEAVTGDVAVGALVRRRLGGEVVDRLVDPLLGGIYAGRADALSLQATLPDLAAALRTPRSLVAAARAALSAGPGDADGRPVFASLRQGLGGLVEALAGRLHGGLTLGLPIRVVRRRGWGFRLTGGPVPDPTDLDADAVVLAVPAAPAARLLTDLAPVAAAELAGVGYASMAIVTLAYTSARLPPGSGLLVGADERRAVKAITFSSQKWAHLSAGGTVVRASIGRYGEEAVLQCDDRDLIALAAADVADLTGLPARPVEARVTRWGGALPQYAVGHLGRVRRIEGDVAGVAGLALAGAVYGGVGVPACIRSGYLAAARIAAQLRQSQHG